MNTLPLNIIVQAGGRGSRLRHHTWNKPKCLVSIHGKPIIYHLFDLYPNANFTIIGDYAFEQLEKYLKLNPPEVNFMLFKTSEKGTAAGIADAASRIPPEQPLMIIWSDIIIKDIISWPNATIPVIATTSSFTCRWSINSIGCLEEIASSENGVPGIFYFPNRKTLKQFPNSGEYVKWYSKNITDFSFINIEWIEEVGDFQTIEKANDRIGFSRFFNKVDIGSETVIKSVIDRNYVDVFKNEILWYQEATNLGFRRIPKILNYEPFTMTRIKGHHPFMLLDLNDRERAAVLADLLDSLLMLHDLDKEDADFDAIYEVYFNKTLSRIRSVQPLIPSFHENTITINGKKCKNYFYENNLDELSSIVSTLCVSCFHPIHGDPTFSNTIVDDFFRAWFIDPRGSFARPGIMGDVWYDYSKVYYSAIGAYDLFNRRKFKLHIDHETVEILMQESPFSRIANTVFYEYFGNNIKKIKIIHGLIWLSLTGYVKDDFDSAIAAFYLGLYWLEDGVSSL